MNMDKKGLYGTGFKRNYLFYKDKILIEDLKSPTIYLPTVC